MRSLSCAASSAGRAVEHGDAARCERSERPDTVVDAVERRQDVDPADRRVTRRERRERLGRRHQAPVGAVAARLVRVLRWRAWGSGRRRRCACRAIFLPSAAPAQALSPSLNAKDHPTDTRCSLPHRDPHPPTARRLARGDLRPDVLGQERGDDPAPAPSRDRRATGRHLQAAHRRPVRRDRRRLPRGRAHARRCGRERPRARRPRRAVTTSSASTRCSSSTPRSSPRRSSLADSGVSVVVSGLDQDFRRLPFGVMPELLAHAEFVDKLQAVCHRCGGTATTTQRLVAGEPAPYSGETIVVGARRLVRGPLPRLPRGGRGRDQPRRLTRPTQHGAQRHAAVR